MWLVRADAVVRSEEGGFFGWHFYAPFDTSEVKTVAVFFKSNSFRRDVEKQLTEAVIKEITMRTPYKVVGISTKRPTRCSSGTITSADKNLVVEAPTNFARELNMTINVAVNWTHNPPTEIEDKQTPDDRHRNDQLRAGSWRDDLERHQPRRPEPGQADCRYDGAAVV